MNMKDAFRFQNKLKNLMCEATSILQDQRNIVKVKTTHLRSKVMSDALDAVVEETAPSEYAGHIRISIREKTEQGHSLRPRAGWIWIWTARFGPEPAAPGTGRSFHRHMTTLRNSEKDHRRRWIRIPLLCVRATRFSYRCDATQVTTIDFDRNKIRGMATALSKKADEISMALDKCLVNTEVAYEAPFDINDSFEEILNDFIEKAAVA